MNYLVIGNIASGKTSLAQELVKKTGADFYSIDGFRKEFSDGTYAGEFHAWYKMLEAIQHPSPNGGVYEFSGTGKNAWFARSAIQYSKEKHNAEWLTVYCLCDRNELFKRCEGRKYDIPIPYKFDNPSSSIQYMSDELQKRFGSNYWNSPEFTVRTDQLTPEQAATSVLNFLK